MQRPFFPTQAYLGYPNDDEEKELSLLERRRQYAVFARKLNTIFRSLLDDNYALHENLTVLTRKGFNGRKVEVDCVAVTSFGVFVVSHLQATGYVNWGKTANEIVAISESGVSRTVPCPILQAAPAVQFLKALFARRQCPVIPIAVVTHNACDVDLSLSRAILKVDELPYFLRQSFARFSVEDGNSLSVRDVSAWLRNGCQKWEYANSGSKRCRTVRTVAGH